MLGSLNEADDAVQEARLTRIDTDAVENLSGWLTTVVSRVCLDMLGSRKSRREESIDVQVTEPSVAPGQGADPEGEAIGADVVLSGVQVAYLGTTGISGLLIEIFTGRPNTERARHEAMTYRVGRIPSAALGHDVGNLTVTQIPRR